MWATGRVGVNGDVTEPYQVRYGPVVPAYEAVVYGGGSILLEVAENSLLFERQHFIIS
jgi:hypothetical protein